MLVFDQSLLSFSCAFEIIYYHIQMSMQKMIFLVDLRKYHREEKIGQFIIELINDGKNNFT